MLKRQNWPKTRNPFIDDQAGVAGEGDEDHYAVFDSPVFEGVEANVHDDIDDQSESSLKFFEWTVFDQKEFK